MEVDRNCGSRGAKGVRIEAVRFEDLEKRDDARM